MNAVDKEIGKRGIIVIESLHGEDLKTGKTLYQDLLQWKELKQNDFYVLYYNVHNKNEFVTLMEQIHSEHKRGDVFTLHFETHGCELGVGLESGEIVDWVTLGNLLRPINEEMLGLLMVVMSMCQGAYILKSADPRKRAPYKAFVGSTRIMAAGQLQDGFLAFYDTYYDMLNIKSAMEALATNTICDDLGCSPFWCLCDFDLFDKLTNLDRDSMALQGWIEKIANEKQISDQEAEADLRSHFEELKMNRSYFCFEDLYGNRS